MPVLSHALSVVEGVAEGPPVRGRGNPLCSEFGFTDTRSMLGTRRALSKTSARESFRICKSTGISNRIQQPFRCNWFTQEIYSNHLFQPL